MAKTATSRLKRAYEEPSKDEGGPTTSRLARRLRDGRWPTSMTSSCSARGCNP